MCMVTVVVPVYNSAAILTELCLRLTTALNKLTPEYEVVLIDDGSGDESFEIMRLLHRQNRRIRIIALAGNFGQQNAVVCGLRHARGQIIITMDDDLQHPPEEIRHLLEPLKEGYDLVFGISGKKHSSFYRNMGSFMTDRVFNLTGLKGRDIRISSFRAVRSETVHKALAKTPGFVYVSAELLKSAKRVISIPVPYHTRHSGESNYNFRKLLVLFFKLFIYYSPFFGKLPKRGRELYVIREKHM